ncbi:cupin domain-containing protein [Streptomyces sp. NRRL S-350]|uniref:cupin domain-containing protein n=1 Tax=Streptomyces sp. NRRL S-350 TaxID=1463902 RepID=UPI0004BFB8C5|nr:cupin domain-containing protein [Streptomyces sp. NRRL S-350]
MIVVPAAVPRTAPVFRRLIDPEQRPSVRAGLTVETLPPGVRVDQLPYGSAESVTVVLSGRLFAAGRVLTPGEALHHRPGSTCRLAAVRGAPTALLTVRPVPSRSDIPAQRSGPATARAWRQVDVDSVELEPGGLCGPYEDRAADAFLLVLSGPGAFLGDLGEVPVFPGDLVYVRAGERYGLRAGSRKPVTAVLGRIGAPGAVPGAARDAGPVRSERVRPWS